MRFLILGALLCAQLAHAESAQETWTVNGKTFESKAMAVRYVMSQNKKGMTVTHSRCEILTNKLTFKACPKNDKTGVENQPYQGPVAP
jgi:hypothetical protein